MTTYFHGTNRPVDQVSPSDNPLHAASAPGWAYATTSEQVAWHYANAAFRAAGGRRRVFEVEPTGEVEPDPNAYFPGNDVRSRSPWRVVREVTTRTKTALPSWRDRGEHPVADCIIAPDLGRSRRNSYLVYTYGQPVARFPSLRQAKGYIEEVYGQVPWRRLPGDQQPRFDPVWGLTTEFNDAPYYWIVERLPMLGTAAAKTAGMWDGIPINIPPLPEDAILAQFEQYPASGPDGISYFKGEIDASTWVDCLLYRKGGRLVGVLNHYPKAMGPERKGNVLLLVHPDHRRQGIGKALWTEAKKRWSVRAQGQDQTPMGRAFTDRVGSLQREAIFFMHDADEPLIDTKPMEYKGTNFEEKASFEFVHPQIATGGALRYKSDMRILARRGITGVVSGRRDFDDALLLEGQPGLGIRTLYLPTPDDGGRKPTSWFKAAIDFCLPILKRGGKVYLHCHAGMNRGPSLAYAVLRAYTGWEAETALAHIKAVRSVALVAYADDAERALEELGYVRQAADVDTGTFLTLTGTKTAGLTGPWWHGTSTSWAAEIERLGHVPETNRSRHNNYGEGVYLTTRLDTAQGFADKRNPGGGVAVPIAPRVHRVFSYEASWPGGREALERVGLLEEYRAYTERTGAWDRYDIEDEYWHPLNEFLAIKGFDATYVTNMDMLVVFDPRNCRWDERRALSLAASRKTAARGSYWHLTSSVNFRLNPKKQPANNTTMGGSYKPGIFLTTQPEHWVNGYGYRQPWLVEFEVPGDLLSREGVHDGGYGNETFVPAEHFAALRIKRVVPLDGWCREAYDEWGWTEEHFGTDYLTGEPLPKPEPGWRSRPPAGHRAPDARQWDKARQDEYKKRVSAYRRKAGRGAYASIRQANTGPNPWWHGCSARRAAEVLSTGGFPRTYLARNTLYGPGLYLTPSRSEALSFGEVALSVAPKASRVFALGQDVEASVRRAGLASQWADFQAHLHDLGDEPDSDTVMLNEFLRLEGFEAIHVEGPNWLVVFDPAQPQIERVAKTAVSVADQWWHACSPRRYAEVMAEGGFRADYSAKTAIYGPGLYLTNQPPPNSIYGKAVLPIKVSGVRGFTVNGSDWPSIRKAFKDAGLDADWTMDRETDGETVVRTLRARGYGALVLERGREDWMLLFDPEKAKVDPARALATAASVTTTVPRGVGSQRDQSERGEPASRGGAASRGGSRRVAGPASGRVRRDRVLTGVTGRDARRARPVEIEGSARGDFARLDRTWQARCKKALKSLQAGQADVEQKKRAPLHDCFSIRVDSSFRIVFFIGIDGKYHVFYMGFHRYDEAERRMGVNQHQAAPNYTRIFHGDGETHYREKRPRLMIKMLGPWSSDPLGNEEVVAQVPWEGDLLKALDEVERKADRIYGDPSEPYAKWIEQNREVYLFGEGENTYVLGQTDSLGGAWRPVRNKVGYALPWPTFFADLRSNPKKTWSEFAKRVGGAQPPDFNLHPMRMGQDVVTVYRGISVKEGVDPATSELPEERGGSGAGSSWTLDLAVAKAIAERGMAGFANENSVFGKPRTVKVHDKYGNSPTRAVVLRATVDLSQEGMSLLTDGRMYYATEQEVDIKRGTEFTLTGVLEADRIPVDRRAMEETIERGMAEVKDKGYTFETYEVTYRWPTRWREVKIKRTAASERTKVWRGVSIWVANEDAREVFKRTATDGTWLLDSLLERRFDADFTGRKPTVDGDGIGVWWTTDRRVAEEYGRSSSRLPNDFGGPDFTLSMVLEGEVDLADVDEARPVAQHGYSSEAPVILRAGGPVHITGIEVSWPVKPSMRNQAEHWRDYRTLPVRRSVTAASSRAGIEVVDVRRGRSGISGKVRADNGPQLAYRGFGSWKEAQDAVRYGQWASRGAFTVPGEGDTQMALRLGDVLKGSDYHDLRGTGFLGIIEADVAGLPFRSFIDRPTSVDDPGLGLLLRGDGASGLIKANLGLGIGIDKGIPVNRIRRVHRVENKRVVESWTWQEFLGVLDTLEDRPGWEPELHDDKMTQKHWVGALPASRPNTVHALVDNQSETCCGKPVSWEWKERIGYRKIMDEAVLLADFRRGSGTKGLKVCRTCYPNLTKPWINPQPKSSRDQYRWASKTAADSADTDGVMVCLVPPMEVSRLLVDGEHATEALDEQHITLAYLGDKGNVDIDVLHETVEAWARQASPLTGRVAGYGTFNNPDSHVLWAAWDLIDGGAWRESLVQTLHDAGITWSEKHGWTPHQTLSYRDDPITSLPAMPPGLPEEVVFGAVVIAYGGQWASYSLSPTVVDA